MSRKVCRICSQRLSRSAFQRRIDSPDGLRTECRECNVAQQRAYRQRHLEKERARDKAKYEALREVIIEDRRRFRAAEAERINVERRKRRAEDPTQFRAVQRDYYIRNRERIKDRVAARGFKRRAADIAALVQRDGAVCGICGEPVVPRKSHIDHIIPRFHGGSNDLHNLQLAHPACNLAKGAKMPGVPPPLPDRAGFTPENASPVPAA